METGAESGGLWKLEHYLVGSLTSAGFRNHATTSKMVLVRCLRLSFFHSGAKKRLKEVACSLDTSSASISGAANTQQIQMPLESKISPAGCGRRTVEELWRHFFADPSQWWDHTMDKVNRNFPDFIHKKKTGVALWLDKKCNPSWVNTELASMIPGSVSRSLHSWNAMLARCVKSNRGQDALELYKQMQAEDVKPDKFIFVTVLNACASLKALDEGRRVHAQTVESGCEADMFVGSSLVDMYVKCGSTEDAQIVFHKMTSRDEVSWCSMLAGYVSRKDGQKALELFQQMQAEGVKPDDVSFSLVLKACANMTALEEGRRIHAQVIESGYELNAFVASSLVNMYAKCGRMIDAQRIFHRMSSRDVVSWSAMLAGYVNCEEGQKALELFQQMQVNRVKPDPVSFVLALKACASIMALEEGRRINEQVVECGCESDVFVGNTLVSMYAKCGSIADAKKVFYRMPTRSAVSWSAMLGALAMHGLGKEALLLFREMCQAGVEIDSVTFTCLLSACSHGGFVEDGIRFFECMDSVYGISPTLEHYACMVDLLGRAGRLDEAEELLRREPVLSKNSFALMALLGACRNHGNVEMGERIAQRVLRLEPDYAVGYVLLSNIQSAAGQRDSHTKIPKCGSKEV